MAVLETPPMPAPRQIVPRLLRWFARHARDLPWRRTRDPYAIWVSEVMLQQTRVETVIPYWERWLRALPDIATLARARPAQLHKLWEGLGYYTRVRNLQRAARIIVEQHGGVFPRDCEAILALPGIGRYTAGAIASIAFNQPAPILDGNVIRVLTRLHGIASDPREKQTNTRLWQLAEQLVTRASHIRTRSSKPETRNAKREALLPCSALNQSLMELGALICTPRAPNCPACPLKKVCVARRTNQVEQLPFRPRRPALTARRFVVFVLEHEGRFLVQQRPAGMVNAQLWEFPNLEVAAHADPKDAARQWWHQFGATDRVRGRSDPAGPVRLAPLVTLNHAITRFRMRAEAYRVVFAGPPPSGCWRTPTQLRRLAFTAAHRRIANALQAAKRAKTGQNAV